MTHIIITLTIQIDVGEGGYLDFLPHEKENKPHSLAS